MIENDDSPTRRQFLLASVGAAGALWLAACDSSEPSTDAGGGGGTDAGPGGSDAGPAVCNQINFEMGSRHPPGFRHSIEVPLADVMAAAEVTYDITGESPHPHFVTVTPAHFAMIAGGARVEIESTEDMGIDLHSHTVTLFCAA